MKPAWTLTCQLCRSACSMVTAHGTECDLPSSEYVSYTHLAGHSLPPILFSQLWFRHSQSSQRNSFMGSASKGANNVQKDSLQWTSATDCAETTDTKNSISWESKRFWLLCFLPWNCLSAHIPSAISSDGHREGCPQSHSHFTWESTKGYQETRNWLSVSVLFTLNCISKLCAPSSLVLNKCNLTYQNRTVWSETLSENIFWYFGHFIRGNCTDL